MLNSRRRRGEPARAEAPLAPIQFRLDPHEEDSTIDGRLLHGRGYLICDPQTGTRLGEDDFFFRIGGGIVCELIDTADHADDLQAPEFRPGRKLALMRHSAVNAETPPVIDVTDPGLTATIGRLPPDVADAVNLYGADTYQAGLSLWEWRDEAGLRVGLRVLLAPGWKVQSLPT